jgi:hypothetical protein
MTLYKLATHALHVPCVIGDQYGFGERDSVREIVFNDAERGIARVGIGSKVFLRLENADCDVVGFWTALRCIPYRYSVPPPDVSTS